MVDRPLMKYFPLALLACTLVLPVGCQDAQKYRPFKETIAQRTMEIGGMTLEIEVAADNQTRQRGLMHRTSMPEDHGMLFAYPTPRIQHFWMKNTFLPLSIAFIDDDGTVVNVDDMQPLEELPGAASIKPVRFALEVNQGWFQRHNIAEGAKVELPDWVLELTPE